MTTGFFVFSLCLILFSNIGSSTQCLHYLFAGCILLVLIWLKLLQLYAIKHLSYVISCLLTFKPTVSYLQNICLFKYLIHCLLKQDCWKQNLLFLKWLNHQTFYFLQNHLNILSFYTHSSVLHTFWCLTHIKGSHTHFSVLHTFLCLIHTLVSYTHYWVLHTLWCLTHIMVSYTNSGVLHTLWGLTHTLVSYTHSGVLYILWCLTHIMGSYTHSGVLHTFWCLTHTLVS